MTIKGAIFDFDGTLFDTMEIWERLGADYLAALGIEAEPGLGDILRPMTMEAAADYLKERYALPLSRGEIVAGIDRTAADFYAHRAAPKEGVIPFLRGLKQAGVKLCVATATDRPLVESALARWGLLELFCGVFTCGQVGRGKDEPDIYALAQARMGTGRGETAVFEDSLHAAVTAKKAGFPLVGVYDRFEPETGALCALADRYIVSFAEEELSLWT